MQLQPIQIISCYPISNKYSLMATLKLTLLYRLIKEQFYIKVLNLHEQDGTPDSEEPFIWQQKRKNCSGARARGTVYFSVLTITYVN